MLFCQKCGALMMPKTKNGKKELSCDCGYKSKEKGDVIIKEKVNLKKEDQIEVIDKAIHTLPKTEEECPKCSHNQAYYWTIQTRAGDEAETRFFECTKCKHTWRVYK